MRPCFSSRRMPSARYSFSFLRTVDSSRSNGVSECERYSEIPSVISAALVLLYMIILQFVTMRFPRYARQCRVLLVLGLNLIFFPADFFASGGIHSGMILFYLLGLALCGILLRGNFGGAVFVISLLVMELSITASMRYPGFVQEMTPGLHGRSMKSALFMSGMALYSIVLLILRSYYQERKQSEELMQKLRDMSAKDALCSLYNRRELFRRMEIMYSGTPKERSETLTREGHYIAMFDVDNFKKLNDTYGHSFGDRALIAVAQVLDEMVRPEAGELTARYGGEEFVSVLTARDMEEAYARAEETRKKVEALHWEDHPNVRVTISGGLIACEEHPDLTQAMHDVDELLYKAKAAGKNQICR